MDLSELLLSFLSFVMIVAIIWFTYTIVNIIVTMVKCKKLDPSLSFCFNTLGKVFYPTLTVIYIIGFFGGLGFLVYGYFTDNTEFYRNGLNVAAFLSVVYGYFLSSIVLIGRKNMMVGRMMIDYRKLKKVNYTYENKMSFVYAQNDYNFSTRFVDKSVLRKRITR